LQAGQAERLNSRSFTVEIDLDNWIG
jgi:hypothetical protein